MRHLKWLVPIALAAGLVWLSLATFGALPDTDPWIYAGVLALYAAALPALAALLGIALAVRAVRAYRTRAA